MDTHGHLLRTRRRRGARQGPRAVSPDRGTIVPLNFTPIRRKDVGEIVEGDHTNRGGFRAVTTAGSTSRLLRGPPVALRNEGAGRKQVPPRNQITHKG